jgi:hypothetical protein
MGGFRMIIRISGIPNTNHYPQEQKQTAPETHFYTPEEPKEEVKKDFGLTLDKEIEKLTIDIIL